MKEANYDSDSSKLHSIVSAPLELIVQSEGSIEIMDPESKERYAVYKGGTLRFYNSAKDDLNNILFYQLDKISNIREGQRGSAIVTLTDNTEHIHKATYVGDKVDEVVSLAEIDYMHPTLNDLEYFVRKNWPDIDYHLFYEEVNDKICVDLELIGREGYDFLQGIHDNYILTEMRMVLEGEFKQYQVKSGIKTEYLRVVKSDLLDVLRRIAMKHTKNLFYEAIRRTEWDGVQRIKDFLYQSGCRAPNLSEKQEEIYLENVLKSLLLSIIERNIENSYDSIQFVPVLIGGQGAGKSSLVSKLGVGFYYPTTCSVSNTKEFYESTQGSIVVELQEGVQFAKDSPESIKSLIDQTRLSFRKSYAAEASRRKVVYSLVVTTNNSLLLSDTTGNRRFFPLFVNAKDVLIPAWQRDDEYMLQIWAEALELYRNGARWRDEIYEDSSYNVLKSIYLSVQEDATDNVGAAEMISEYLDTNYPKVGDKINHYQLKEYLEGTGYWGQELKESLKVFMKSPAAFGFSEARRVNAYVPSMKQSRRVKEYHRILEPMSVRVSA